MSSLTTADMSNFSRVITSLTTVTLSLMLNVAHAAEEMIVSGLGITVTATDITAEASKLSPEGRKAALASPGTVSQIASNLFLRRAMATEIERLNLTADPLVKAALQAARDRVLADIMLARIDAAHTPSDDSLEKFALSKYRAEPQKYESPAEINVRHILIRSTTPGAHGKAEMVLQQLKSGAAFASIAKTYSDDKGSADKGGELGFAPRGVMVAPFEKAAWALKEPGDLSGIVQSEFGFHIIQLIAKKAAGLRSFDEVRTQIRAEILTTVLTDARKAEAQRLLDSATFDSKAIEALTSRSN